MILFTLLFFNLICIAQNKIIDKSNSKTPKWISEFSSGFIICSATGSSIEEAKEKAFLQVKQEIANSIAVNIQSSSTLSQKEESVNKKGSITESLQSEIKTKTANIPALKGISISKATDVFWQKESDKSHTVIYRFFIKYPLSQSDLYLLLQEFNEMEEQMNTQLAGLSNYSSNISSTDDIDKMISKVDELILYFSDSRKEKAVSLKTQLLNLYSKIDLRIDINTKNELDFKLILFKKEIQTTDKPTFRSNCCSEFNYQNDRLTYSSGDCYEADNNFIEISYSFVGYRLYKKIIINNK